MSARRIDLHTHSTASDGTTPPADLVREAREQGLDVIALTDHDTTGGWVEAQASLPVGLDLVRGAEISCVHGGISLHLLAYLFDPAEPAFAAARLELRSSRVGRAEPAFAAARLELRSSRVGRAEQMARMLEADGTGVTWTRVQEIAQGTIGRPHVAQALIEQGHVGTVSEAFTPEWIGTHGRYYVDKHELDVLDAVRLVVGAGGVAVFAHPGATKRGRTVGDHVIVEMAGAGLAGLEVDHVDHDPAMRTHLRGLAAELGLLTTGSSDFHGTAKTVRLGAETTSESAYDQIIATATGLEVLTG